MPVGHWLKIICGLVVAWMKSCGDDGGEAHWLLSSLCPEGAYWVKMIDVV